jgi:hypothetical protein
MRGLVGVLLGAVALGGLTAFYHQSLPPDQQTGVAWDILLLQAAPAGAALGLAGEIALRVSIGGRRALCCFAGGLLSLVPLGVWCWLTVSGNPFEAIPSILRLLLLSAPTLAASLLMSLWGLVNLRPTRFRKKDAQETDEA